MYLLATNPTISPYSFYHCTDFWIYAVVYVLVPGLGLAICVLDSITARYG